MGGSRDSGTLSSVMSDGIVLSIFNGRGMREQGLCAVTVNGTALLPQELSPDVDPMLLS